MRPREDFGSDQQYKRYKVAVDFGLRMKKLMDKGYIFFDEDGSIVEGTIEIDSTEYAAVALVNDGCAMGLVPYSYGDDGIPWIDETLKEMKSYFRKYRLVNPKNIHNFY